MNDFENNETTKLLMTNNNIYDDDEPDEGIADADGDEPLVKIDDEQFYDDFKDDYDYNCDDYDFSNELSNLNDINFDDFDWERDDEQMIVDEILEQKAEEMESKLMLKIPWDSRPLISGKVNAKC